VIWLWVRGRIRTGGNEWPLHHQSGGAFLLLPTPTMTEGACLPLGTQPLPRGQPSVDWMPAMVSTMETTKGLPAPLWTPAANTRRLGGDTVFHSPACGTPHNPSGAMCIHWLHSMAMMKDSGLRIRVERELREKFLAACRKQDRPAAQVIREFMRTYVADTDQPNDDRQGQSVTNERR